MILLSVPAQDPFFNTPISVFEVQAFTIRVQLFVYVILSEPHTGL